MQPSLRAIAADPMHLLFAAKGGIVGMNAKFGIAFMVPVKQQWVLRCFECWLWAAQTQLSAALRSTTVIFDALMYSSLPFVAACWALPFSHKVTASKYLLRCLEIFVPIPVF